MRSVARDDVHEHGAALAEHDVDRCTSEYGISRYMTKWLRWCNRTGGGPEMKKPALPHPGSSSRCVTSAGRPSARRVAGQRCDCQGAKGASSRSPQAAPHLVACWLTGTVVGRRYAWRRHPASRVWIPASCRLFVKTPLLPASCARLGANGIALPPFGTNPTESSKERAMREVRGLPEHEEQVMYHPHGPLPGKFPRTGRGKAWTATATPNS